MVDLTNEQMIKDLEAKKIQAMVSFNFDEEMVIQNQIDKIKASFSGESKSGTQTIAQTSVSAVPPSQSVSTPVSVHHLDASKLASEKIFFNQLEELDQIFVKNLFLRCGIVQNKLNMNFSPEENNSYVIYVYDILNLCKKQKDERSAYFYLGLNSDGIKNYLLNLDSEQLTRVIKIFTYMKQTTEDIKNTYIGMDSSLKNFEGKDFLFYYNEQNGEKNSLSSENIKNFCYSICTKLFSFENLYLNIINLAETSRILSLQK